MKISATFSLLFPSVVGAFAPLRHVNAPNSLLTIPTTRTGADGAAAAAVASSRSSSALFAAGTAALVRQTGRSQLDPAVMARYDALPYPSDTVIAEYVWVDADGKTRSKTRTLPATKVGFAYRIVGQGEKSIVILK